MPKARLPLVPQHTTRGTNASANVAKDGRIINGIITVAPNPIARSAEVFIEKRVGMVALNAFLVGQYKYGISSVPNVAGAGFVYTTASAVAPGLSSAGVTNVYRGTTLLGTSDSEAGFQIPHIVSAKLSGTTFVFFSHGGYRASETNGGSVYYYDTSVDTGTSTFTADTTSGSPILSNVSSTTNLRVGQRLSGTGIHADARIAAGGISGTNVTMTNNASASNPTVTITQQWLSKIMSPNFPSRPYGPVQSVNGRIFVADRSSGAIYQSALNDPQTWSASEYIATDSNADALVTIENLGGSIYAISQNSIEKFSYANNASGSQLSRASSITTTGAQDFAHNVATSFMGAIYFYGFRGGIYRLGGSGIQNISTAPIDSIMESAVQAAGSSKNIFVDGFYYSGRPFLSVGCVAGSTAARLYQFFYDITNNVWLEQSFEMSSSVACRLVVAGIEENDTCYILPVSDLGTLHRLNFGSPVYQDDGNAYTLTIQLPRSDLGTINRKFIKSVGWVGDTQSSGTMTLAYSDDDGANFTTAGTFDKTNPNIRIYRLGSHKGGRIYRLTDSHNSACRLQAIDIEYEAAST